jgi:hypothetical protein
MKCQYLVEMLVIVTAKTCSTAAGRITYVGTR